ncbi:MAG: hypothetical protein LQ350_003627, partial [Teloschistes chrysophthalmus]
MDEEKQTGDASATRSPPSGEVVSSTADDTTLSTQREPYSHFTKKQKRLIIFIAAFACTFSPLSSFIFFPAINALSNSLHVSVEKINLTITSYMIVSGIAPALMGDRADMTGRRMAYLLTFGLYLIANVGLALQNRWIALFLLRMLQSAGPARVFPNLLVKLSSILTGSKAIVALGYGVLSDTAAPSERGGYAASLVFG